MNELVVESLRITEPGIHFVFDVLDESAVQAAEMLHNHAAQDDVRADVLRELSVSGAISNEDAEMLVPVLAEWQAELGLEEFVVAPTKLITIATGGPSTYIALVSIAGDTDVDYEDDDVDEEEDDDGEQWVD